MAFEWLNEYVNKLCISTPWNWKIAKKQIAAFYFGKPPSLQIYCRSDLYKVKEFVFQNADKRVRCSFHRFDAACHSESRRIKGNDFS